MGQGSGVGQGRTGEGLVLVPPGPRFAPGGELTEEGVGPARVMDAPRLPRVLGLALVKARYCHSQGLEQWPGLAW